MQKEKVTVRSYKGLYYLHRKIEGKNYLGRIQYETIRNDVDGIMVKPTWVVKRVKQEAIDSSYVIDPKQFKIKGHNYPPFSDKDVEKFQALSKTKLDKIYEDGK